MPRTSREATRAGFGLSRAARKNKLEEQGGVCAICGEKPGNKSLAADHDHESGMPRGLLCLKCNLGLGNFHDNPGLLARAIRYLEAYRKAAENFEFKPHATMRVSKDGAVSVKMEI